MSSDMTYCPQSSSLLRDAALGGPYYLCEPFHVLRLLEIGCACLRFHELSVEVNGSLDQLVLLGEQLYLEDHLVQLEGVLTAQRLLEL